MSRVYYSSLVACLSVFLSAVIASAEQPALPAAVDRKVDFAKDVEPILAARCYKCHGEKKQESAFRLDQRDAALKGGELGRDIVLGDSAASPLIQALVGASESISAMPEKGERLSDEQIGVLRAWIDQGANWPQQQVATQQKDRRDHWAYKAPVRPPVPQVRNANWAHNEIDRFILAHLEQEGLTPTAPADKITLLRRLSLDLTGLPPTVAEVDEFLADTREDAYERQVERLLASPHYGERWGRYWLDAARYSDSDGFEKDKSRSVWFYRDWVVNSFNRDLPYNQFIIEQLAGDQLPNATQDQLVATGFLRNSMHNEEGGVDPEQFRMDAMYDRMDAVGKSILGVTIQCCQCHNHKYDPIAQEEYYRLFAYLNNDHESQIAVYTPPELQKRDELTRQIHELEADLQRQHSDWQQRMANWEDQAKAGVVAWEVLTPDQHIDPNGGTKLKLLDDRSMLCEGFLPTSCEFRVVAKTPFTNITALRIETLRHPDLPLGGPGRSYKGTFGLTEVKVEVPEATDNKWTHLKFATASADFEQPETPLEKAFFNKTDQKRVLGPAKFVFDGKNETGWGIDTDPGRQNQDRKIVLQFEKPITLPAGSVIRVDLNQYHGGWNPDDHQNNLIGRFRLAVTQAAGTVAVDPLPRDVRSILDVARDQRTPEQTAAVFSYWRTTVPEWSEINNKIEALWREWPVGTTSLVLKAREKPRETHVLKRGDFLSPLAAVSPGVPSVFHPLPADAAPTRLTLARWMAARESPTTARVFVNRVWQVYFGTGIVGTSEDFGVQSDPPSHPQLLDWLACEFMDSQWSVKRLHRLITMSSTYRQASTCSPELHTADPFNRLLARGARCRVEGEVVRDVSLAASGLLNPKLGGPSVFPPIPESLLALSFASISWNEEKGEDRYRRALYTFRRRTLPYPVLQNFDTPNGDSSCVRRTRSNTPLQALTTLNEVVFMECARELARRTLLEGGASDADRISYAFRRCVSRRPSEAEVAELTALLEQQRARIADGWLNTREIVTGKNEMPAEMPNGSTPAQFAAYTLVARVILNLDETMTKE